MALPGAARVVAGRLSIRMRGEAGGRCAFGLLRYPRRRSDGCSILYRVNPSTSLESEVGERVRSNVLDILRQAAWACVGEVWIAGPESVNGIDRSNAGRVGKKPLALGGSARGFNSQSSL